MKCSIPFLFTSLCTAILSLFTTEAGFAAGIVYPDFETSMLRITPDQDPFSHSMLEREALYRKNNRELLSLFKKIYDKHTREVVSLRQANLNRIPRIIHQIWLGSQVPEELRSWMSSWQSVPGWKYMLWTDKEVAEFHLHNRDLYEVAENYAEKSDILRLEILSKFGGLYVDTDCECLRPEIFEELHTCYDFYIGFEPLEHGSVGRFNMFQTCNAVIGSIPHHPLVKELITNLKANFLAYKGVAGTCHKTGPSYLTRIICAYEKGDAYAHRNIYLPSTFFYAFSEQEVIAAAEQEALGLPTFLETASHHWWHGTWRKGEHYYGSIRSE